MPPITFKKEQLIPTADVAIARTYKSRAQNCKNTTFVTGTATVYPIFLNGTSLYYRQITVKIVGYHFSSRLTATLNLGPIYL